MKKSALSVLAMALVIALPLAFAAPAKLDLSAPSWTAWRGPAGDGVSPDAALDPAKVTQPKFLWKVNVGLGYSSVCVVGGFVFTAGKPRDNQEVLVCLDGKTGATVWSYAYPSEGIDYPGSRSTPVYDSGNLYILSLTGVVHCVDASSGAKLWSVDVSAKAGARRPTWAFASSCLIEKGMAIFNVGSNGIALDKKTGAIIWKSGADEAGYSTPEAFDYKGKRLLALMGKSALKVVDASTGALWASAAWVTQNNVNAMDPLIFDDKILISSAYDHGAALFKLGDKSLAKLWETKTLQSHFPGAIYLDGYIYGSSGSAGSYGAFVCMDAATGAKVWAKSGTLGSIIRVGSMLVALSETATLLVLEASPTAYVELARSASAVVPRLAWTAPVLAGGRLYVRGDKGDLACIDVAK